MKNDFLSKIKSSIKKDDLREFAIVLNSEISEGDIANVFNLFCESSKLFIDSKSGFIEYVSCFANIFPKYYFEHLNRLYYNNLKEKDIIIGLFQNSLYLKFENEYTDEIIKHLKSAYFYCSDKDLLLDKIESIEFNNDKILQIIDELIILRNIQIDIEQVRRELSSYSWDFTFYSICIFLEDYGTNKLINKAVEFILNEKPKGYFHGNDKDFIVFLASLKSNELNIKKEFAGHQIKVSDLKNSFKRLTLLFQRVLDYLQIESITSDYCLRNNLEIKEKEKDCYEFCTIDIENEEHYQRDGIKYQIESDYFHLVVQENELKNSNADLKTDYNLQLQLSIKKAKHWLSDRGMIKSKELDQLVILNGCEVPLNILLTYISVQCIHSKRLYGNVNTKTEGKDAIEKLIRAFMEGMKTGIDSGIPFHLRNIEDFENGFVKAFGNPEHLGFDFTEKCKTVLNLLVFDKEGEGNEKFSFDSHTHIKLGNKIFGFRKTLSVYEPSHFAFNVLLSDSKNKEYNQDTSITETNIIEGLKINGFDVLNDTDRKDIKKYFKIDFDVLAYKSGVIFSFEVKTTHFRRDLKEINLHTNRELMKAAFQLDKNVDFIDKNPAKIANALGCSVEDIRSAIKKTYIVSTSLEEDHNCIGGHLKISYFELMRTFYNEKWKVILPFLSSSHYYPNIYTSDFVNSFADTKSELELAEKMNDLFISCDREEFLGSSQLFRSLENGTFWDFMEGIQYPIQKVNIKNGKLTVYISKNYSIKSENIAIVNRLLGI